MNYFISDLHLGHENILKYDNRPFGSIEEHDKALIDAINDTLSAGDTLWHLGDVAWSQKAFVAGLARLRTDIVVQYLQGNHDNRVGNLVHWPDVAYRNDLYRGTPPCFMSHYPHRSWPNSFHGSIHLYGHVHGQLPPAGDRSKEVSANVIGYKPISWLEVVEELTKIPSPKEMHQTY